jgi:ribosomal protein S18 acetylase RimI-like enzyme
MSRVRELFLEYAGSLSFSHCFEGFDEEVSALPGVYAPPGGAIALAESAGRALGVVALRHLTDSVCEMKRLYVRPEARGAGIGRGLAEAIMTAARQAGYRTVRLNTHDMMSSAIALYRDLGFVEIQAGDNPRPGIRHFARRLP